MVFWGMISIFVVLLLLPLAHLVHYLYPVKSTTFRQR